MGSRSKWTVAVAAAQTQKLAALPRRARYADSTTLHQQNDTAEGARALRNAPGAVQTHRDPERRS